MKTIYIFIITFSIASSVLGQFVKGAKYIKMPSEIDSILIPYQPDCSVKIEEATSYVTFGPEIERRAFVNFKVRNLSDKEVRLVNFTQIAIGGDAGDLFHTDSNPTVISPHGTLVYNQIPESDIVPLTDKLKEDLHWKNRSVVVVLFVKEVLFADGTIYKEPPFHDKLFNFLSSIEPPNQ